MSVTTTAQSEPDDQAIEPSIDDYAGLRDRMLRGDLARQRIIAGLTRAEVDERCGWEPGAAESIEEGTSDPLMSSLRRYCLAIGVVIGWHLLVPTDDPRAVGNQPETREEPTS